ncbi:MAG TPA: hypothetical protein VIV66_20630 [Pyrinomonadaceae bacterium]
MIGIEVAGGWFVGRLEVVFTNLGLSCAETLPTIPAASKNAAATRNANFLNVINFNLLSLQMLVGLGAETGESDHLFKAHG